MKRILTIAGSDSGGGAGIQADLKTITLLGGFGMSAVTALTAQNTVGVQGIVELDAEFVKKQIDSVLSDIGADAIKTGMLANSEIIRGVAEKIKEYAIEKVVVDPVMVAKSGDALLKKEAQETVKGDLLPLCYLVTPNLPEASVLSGHEVKGLDDMKRAARVIRQLGARNVLVKGGHLPGRPIDLLFDGERFHEFEEERVQTRNTHGTGCTYAAAIATELAKGKPLEEAIKEAKAFLTVALRFSLNLGKGHGPTNHYAMASREIERYRVIESLKEGFSLLQRAEVGRLIPEVQSNLGYALPHGEKRADIAAFPGRIVRINDSVEIMRAPEFNASQHIANIILTVMKHDPEYRSAMNLRYSEEILQACSQLHYSITSFDRKREPDDIKATEGSSLEWGVEWVLRTSGGVPNIIYDEGDRGREAMVRVIGRNPREVVDKVVRINQGLMNLH
jgi:hydroxymethylpyrimidine kinase/phosphomethylpyrimidine kinase